MNFTFSDINNYFGKYKTFVYSDSQAVLGECLRDGILRTLGFGKTSPNFGVDFSFKKFPDREETAAFVVELDGVSLIDRWEYMDHDEAKSDDCLTVKVHFRHGIVPCEVWVCTKWDGSGCFSRWLEIKNCADRSVSLTRVAVISGKFEYLEDWQNKLSSPRTTPYRLGYFEQSEWKYEGQFRWHELHADRYSFGGRYTRFRYRHPFCVLQNRVTGDTYAMQMAYSGGYLFSFDFRNSPAGEGFLAFSADIDGRKPLRNLKSGEVIRTPEVLITRVHGGLDEAVQQMHTHIRNVYVPKSFKGAMFLEACHKGGGVDPAWAKRAADAGMDIAYLDASWFSKEPGNFIDFVGDWDANETMFPKGYRELTDICHANGIRCGLWMEPERVGKCSRRQESDKDKFLRDEKGEIIRGELDGIPYYVGESGFYDLSRKDVCGYVEEMICRTIEETGVDHFRLDCNIEYYAPWCMNWDGETPEAVDFRYHENLYAMWKRLRERYPDVVFENCASGGGRTDLGMLRYFDHTWISDHHAAPQSFTILNGLTMCLPPEILTSIVSPDKPTDYDRFLALFTRPSFGYQKFDELTQWIDTCKNFARPLLRECRFYHHTPDFNETEPTGYGILEAASPDGTRDMIGIFFHHDPAEEEVTLKCKGVSASFRYRVTDYGTGEQFTADGHELKYRGIPVTPTGALSAKLLLIEKI